MIWQFTYPVVLLDHCVFCQSVQSYGIKPQLRYNNQITGLLVSSIDRNKYERPTLMGSTQLFSIVFLKYRKF
jgi:hypothetical protein